MEVNMQDARQQHEQQQQQQQQHVSERQQQHVSERERQQIHTQQDCMQLDPSQEQSAAAQHSAADQVQQPVDRQAGHGYQQQRAQTDTPQQQQQQSQPGSKHRQRRREFEGPNVYSWWLSESEGEGDDEAEEEQQRLAKAEDELYDPEADEADEAWAEQQRSGRTTDAILSCPGCFTTLCIDCQQHELYHTQYRAMFTQNCEVKVDEVVTAQVQRQQQHGRKRRAGAAAPQQAGPELLQEEGVLHPVCCAVCGTQVGAQDADEIVHFHQVLASEC